MELQNRPNLAKAIIAVMKAVVGVEKNLSVGAGQSSYKGVGDQDVKKAVGSAMEKHGLCLLPIGVEPTVRIDRWEETGGQYGPKQKQQVFTEVKTRYLLLHESGESVELEGYGHGIDTQDKSAGKATTYALKYTLLYAFLVPTGKIDDADKEHSEEKEVPPKNKAKAQDSMADKMSPFKRKYETVEQCRSALNDTKEIKEVASLYYVNAGMIESDEQLKADFTSKKNALYNAQLPSTAQA